MLFVTVATYILGTSLRGCLLYFDIRLEKQLLVYQIYKKHQLSSVTSDQFMPAVVAIANCSFTEDDKPCFGVSTCCALLDFCVVVMF